MRRRQPRRHSGRHVLNAELAILSGWGRALRSASVTLRPDGMDDAKAVFAATPRAHGLIAYGAGRSYGDCALNAEGSALLTAGLTGILGFDPDTGILDAEPGVTFRQLLDVFLPRGFMAPVTPGTSFATLGGAVANDVHGKNHEVSGSFGRHSSMTWVHRNLPRILMADEAVTSPTHAIICPGPWSRSKVQ